MKGKDVAPTIKVTPNLYRIQLLSYSDIMLADKAISKCWDKELPTMDARIERIDRVANKYRHASTIEHIVYTFDIQGIPRGVLQELARHRIASYSVKSTRYTLGELKGEKPFDTTNDSIRRALKYVVIPTEKADVAKTVLKDLEALRELVVKGYSNDDIKLALPEAYRTDLVMTINARSLQNFLALRTDRSAWKYIRELAYGMWEVIPTHHKFLFYDCVKGES